MGRISSDSIEKAALSLGKLSEVDGIFISCTNLRIAKRIASMEKVLGGKPVTSSNHALAWHALYLSGIGHPNAGDWGSLYKNIPNLQNK